MYVYIYIYIHNGVHPIRIAKISCTLLVPRAGWSGHLFVDGFAVRFSQRLGPLGRTHLVMQTGSVCAQMPHPRPKCPSCIQACMRPLPFKRPSVHASVQCIHLPVCPWVQKGGKRRMETGIHEPVILKTTGKWLPVRQERRHYPFPVCLDLGGTTCLTLLVWCGLVSLTRISSCRGTSQFATLFATFEESLR